MATADIVMHQVGQAMWSNGSITDICDIANFRRVKSFSFSPKDQKNVSTNLRDAAMRMLSVKDMQGNPISKMKISKENSLYCDVIYPMEVNLLTILDDGMMDQLITDIVDYMWYASSKPDSMLMIQYTCTDTNSLDIDMIKGSASFDYMSGAMFKSITIRGRDGRAAFQFLDRLDSQAYQEQLTRIGLAGYLSSTFSAQAYFSMSSELFRKYCPGVRMDIMRNDDMIFTVVDDIIHDEELNMGTVKVQRTLMSNGELVSQAHTYYGRILTLEQRVLVNERNIELFRTLSATLVPDLDITCRILFRPSEEGRAFIEDKQNILQNALSHLSMEDRALMAIGELNPGHPLRVIMNHQEEAQAAFADTGDSWAASMATELKRLWDAYWLVTHCSDKAKVSSCIASRSANRISKGARFLSTIYGITITMAPMDFDL